MDANMLGRLYKGEEYTMTLPVPFSGEVDDFQFLLFTDSATTVEIPKSQITIEDGVMEFTVQETDLDVLNDGVLNYYLKYTVGSTDKIQCTNTMHYLKSPDDYNPKTTQDIYNEGYNDGIEAAGGDYSEGFVDGEQAQKDKLTGITINQNGTYQREDGYNNVIVSVPQTQYNSQSKNYNLTSNGTTTITPDAGYDGITGGTITVDVPQTGGTFVTQTKNYNITANGNTNITPDLGYDGITGGTITVAVPQTGHTDEELTEAYNRGYNYRESLIVPLSTVFSPGNYVYQSGVTRVVVQTGEYNAGAMYIDFNLYFRNYGIESMLIKGLEGSNDFEQYDIQPGTTYSNVQLLTTVEHFTDQMLTASNDYMEASQGEETLLLEINNIIFYGNSAGFLFDLRDIMNYTDFNFRFTSLLGGQFTNYDRNVEIWTFAGSHTSITFNSPLGHVGYLHLPNCNEIRLPSNYSVPYAYYTRIKQELQPTGTLYCKQAIYADLSESDFWHTFPDGWVISPSL